MGSSELGGEVSHEVGAGAVGLCGFDGVRVYGGAAAGGGGEGQGRGFAGEDVVGVRQLRLGVGIADVSRMSASWARGVGESLARYHPVGRLVPGTWSQDVRTTRMLGAIVMMDCLTVSS